MKVHRKHSWTLECGHVGNPKKGCGKRTCWNYRIKPGSK